MFRYTVENLNIKDMKQATDDIQNCIHYSQRMLSREQERILLSNGSKDFVSLPEAVGIIGEIFLPEGAKASKIDKDYIDYIKKMTIQASNYLAKSICNACYKVGYYDYLITLFYDPEDIVEVSFMEDGTEEMMHKEIRGCYVIENEMFGTCFVEQLFLQVMLDVKIDLEGKILEITFLHSNIMGV